MKVMEFCFDETNILKIKKLHKISGNVYFTNTNMLQPFLKILSNLRKDKSVIYDSCVYWSVHMKLDFYKR